MKCSVCSFPQASEVDTLLSTGSSVRKVSHLYGLSRSTVGRHRTHIAPASRPFAVVEGGDGPTGTPGPLEEAFLLAARARTPRERLRALEQVRAATKLRLKGVEDIDREDRELLDNNIAQAEAAYRHAGDYEAAIRGLSGWREAIAQRLDAAEAPDLIEVRVPISLADGSSAEPYGGETIWRMTPDLYWRGVPGRFRDLSRFVAETTTYLAFDPQDAGAEIKVYNRDDHTLVWASDTRRSVTTGERR